MRDLNDYELEAVSGGDLHIPDDIDLPPPPSGGE